MRNAGLIAWVFQDWEVNAGRPENRLILAWFRLAQRAHNRWGLPGKLAVCYPYRLVTTLLLSIELPVRAEVGPRLRLVHKCGIVVHERAVIGADCRLRHGVTIGAKLDRDGRTTAVASIGDDVEFGAGSMVIGVDVGDHARIGALAIVTKPVPAWAVVAGNPGRVVRIDAPAAVPAA
jgi:serine acetyltransferase